MDYRDEIIEKLTDNFDLICKITDDNKTLGYDVSTERIEEIINNEIPEALKKNAPPDYYELYTNFKYSYDYFKNYILYDKLIDKNIVALGGGFSSGKSSFMNVLNGERALPVGILPTTSVPTYIVRDDRYRVTGINIFKSKFEIRLTDFNKIAHGFGEIEDEEGNTVVKGASLGHMLKSMFLSTPKQMYDKIAFLDTPGYSKADDEIHSDITDEQIARGQLNSSDFILWFVPAEKGTLTDEDIKFIETLNDEIPKLIILSKADKMPEEELHKVRGKIRDILRQKQMDFIDILLFSVNEPEKYDIEKIKAYFDKFNKTNVKADITKNFKKIFVRCNEYYDCNLDMERKRLGRLNQAVAVIDDRRIAEGINQLTKDVRENIEELKNVKSKLENIEKEFFKELKDVSDKIGFEISRISEMEILKESKSEENLNFKKSVNAMSVKKENSFSKIIKNRR